MQFENNGKSLHEEKKSQSEGVYINQAFKIVMWANMKHSQHEHHHNM